jgi:hypothetical protein
MLRERLLLPRVGVCVGATLLGDVLLFGYGLGLDDLAPLVAFGRLGHTHGLDLLSSELELRPPELELCFGHGPLLFGMRNGFELFAFRHADRLLLFTQSKLDRLCLGQIRELDLALRADALFLRDAQAFCLDLRDACALLEQRALLGELMFENELLREDILALASLLAFAHEAVALGQVLLCDFRDLATPLSVEDVLGLEEMFIRLVELRNRRGFEHQAVRLQVVGHEFDDLGQERVAFGVELFETLSSSGGSESADQLVLDELLDTPRIGHFLTERTRCLQDALVVRLDPDEKLCRNVRAELVERDESILVAALDLELDGLQRHRHELVQDRDDQCATIANDPNAAGTGAHERLGSSRALVEACEHEEQRGQPEQAHAGYRCPDALAEAWLVTESARDVWRGSEQ